MEVLSLSGPDIDDKGAFALMDCMHKILELQLNQCRISKPLITQLVERGKKVGCMVNVDFWNKPYGSRFGTL